MKKNANWNFIQVWILLLCLNAVSIFSHAQEIEISPTSDNSFSFEIIGENEAPFLNIKDLVYYHFSDGSNVQVNATPDNPTAKYSRQFANVSEAFVIAYVARKNGPLEFAPSREVPIADPCTDCQDPLVIMPVDDFDTKAIKLSTSWEPFSNPSLVIEPFPHDITTPSFFTPDGEAWFFLNVHLEANPTGWPLSPRIIIPPAFSVEGVVIKGNWAELEQGGAPNSTVVIGSEFKTIHYNGNGNINITMEGLNFEGQAKLSLLMKGNPGDYLNTLQVFRGRVETGEGELDIHELPIKVKTNPHDPNKIKAKNQYVCTGQEESDPYGYIVDFQNTGEGYAEDIFISIDVDPTIMDAFSVENLPITASHDYTITEVNSDRIIFKFEDIQLPGTIQEYPSHHTLEETKGQITFSLKTIPCLIPELGVEKFYTSGEIKFLCCYDENNENPFTEITPLNKIEQKLNDECTFDPNCLKDFPNPDTGISGRGLTNDPNRSYPNPFTTQLHVRIASMVLETSVTLDLIDVNGFVHVSEFIEQNVTESILLSTENLSSGVYFLRISNENKIRTYKVIKQ